MLIGLYILAFGGGSTHGAGTYAMEASRRWAQAKWQKDAWFMFELQGVATSNAITLNEKPSKTRLFSFFGFVTLLYSPSWSKLKWKRLLQGE